MTSSARMWVLIDQPTSRRGCRVGDDGASTAAQVPADHVVLAHNPLDPLAVDPHALVAQLNGHSRDP